MDVESTVEYIEIDDPFSDHVEQFCDVLVEAFPDPYDREDIPILRKNLEEGSWTDGEEVCRYHLITAQRHNRVIGGTSFYFFSDGRTALGMGAYLAVRREFRNKGIGTGLIEARNRVLLADAQEFNRHLKGLVIQISEPKLMSASERESDSIDPLERERFWRRRGYRKIDFNFIQPPIRNSEPPVEYLSLYIFPYCQQWREMDHISRDELRGVINCFIKCTGTPGPTECDASYLRMKTELAAREKFRII